jgi:hypothetical protein
MKRTNGKSYRGVIRKGLVHSEDNARLPEGRKVLVTPVERQGDPKSLLNAVESLPTVKSVDVEEMLLLIRRGRTRVRFENPLGSALAHPGLIFRNE